MSFLWIKHCAINNNKEPKKKNHKQLNYIFWKCPWLLKKKKIEKKKSQYREVKKNKEKKNKIKKIMDFMTNTQHTHTLLASSLNIYLKPKSQFKAVNYVLWPQ